MLRGREQEAGRIVSGIEKQISARAALPPVDDKPLKIRIRDRTPWGEVFKYMLGESRQRSLLGFILMVGQAFFFNAVFFTFGLVGMKFFRV